MYATMISLAIGFIALITGRQVYWLYSGGITLVSIYILTPIFIDLPQTNELLVIAALGGIVVGLFTLLFGRPMVLAAAFLSGGYLAVMAPIQLGIGTVWLSWIVYVLGGVIAIVASLVWFDTVIIVLSAITGSSLILHTLALGTFDRIIAFTGIAIIGIAIQSILMRYYPEEIEG
jgi:hypothetical protein